MVLGGTQERGCSDQKSQVSSTIRVYREGAEEGFEIQTEVFEWRWFQWDHEKTSLRGVQVLLQLRPLVLSRGNKGSEMGILSHGAFIFYFILFF